MSIDIREDVLMRPEPTFAPYSVYVDVSPIRPTADQIDYMLTDEEQGLYVSDRYRVWELFMDCHNIGTATVNMKIQNSNGSVAKIYDNALESFISDHPVFGK